MLGLRRLRAVQSNASDWPLLWRGVLYWKGRPTLGTNLEHEDATGGEDDDDTRPQSSHQIYFIGNPVGERLFYGLGFGPVDVHQTAVSLCVVTAVLRCRYRLGQCVLPVCRCSEYIINEMYALCNTPMASSSTVLRPK